MEVLLLLFVDLVGLCVGSSMVYIAVVATAVIVHF